MNKSANIRFAFFGSSRFSAIVLDELEKAGFIPAIVVTTPDKPQGRKLTVMPNEAKEWAVRRGISVLDSAEFDADLAGKLKNADCELFVVASYGKIIPKAIIDLPARKTLNIHPSLLPKYRGASPLQSAMLADDKKTGVTVMRIDEKMDHGPIVAQKEISVDEWPAYEAFEELMAREGARLLASVIPDRVAGAIAEKEQDHAAATYTKKIAKEDGLIDLADDPYLNFRKIQAYHAWPQAYFFVDQAGRKMRVKITSASFMPDQAHGPGRGALVIERVVPEGKREMAYADFKNGYQRPSTGALESAA